jgi:hypothetical protein
MSYNPDVQRALEQCGAHDKYKGKIGPADAMNALLPEFKQAYVNATHKLMGAVIEFERITGRVVDGIDIYYLDLTTAKDENTRMLRTTAITFLPTPGEVAW